MLTMSTPVAIITGAGRGIGRATAVELSRRGYRLGLVSRNDEELRETAKLSDREALIAPADVADAHKLQQVVANALSKFGRVDAVVNNAGFAPVRSIEQTTAAEWQAVIDTNVSAAFFLSQA